MLGLMVVLGLQFYPTGKTSGRCSAHSGQHHLCRAGLGPLGYLPAAFREAMPGGLFTDKAMAKH